MVRAVGPAAEVERSMLSQNERRQLEEIERRLRNEDPRLANRLTLNWVVRHRWIVLATGILGAALFVLGCVCASGTLAIWGFVMAAVAGTLLFRHRTRRRG
ncbi:MAG TPA: DUF3040 domain-containing protein [Kutzneria sp.]|nr:DUF3040 domain-containing protein [Kutzneria sp.]